MYISVNWFIFTCLECDATSFKPDLGIQQCFKCGTKSVADFDRKICNCINGYKRAAKNAKDYTTECFGKLNFFLFFDKKLL